MTTEFPCFTISVQYATLCARDSFDDTSTPMSFTIHCVQPKKGSVKYLPKKIQQIVKEGKKWVSRGAFFPFWDWQVERGLTCSLWGTSCALGGKTWWHGHWSLHKKKKKQDQLWRHSLPCFFQHSQKLGWQWNLRIPGRKHNGRMAGVVNPKSCEKALSTRMSFSSHALFHFDSSLPKTEEIAQHLPIQIKKRMEGKKKKRKKRKRKGK